MGNKVVSFEEKKCRRDVRETLPILSDEEVDKAVLILMKIKSEENAEKKRLLGEDFTNLVNDAISRKECGCLGGTKDF